MTPFRLSPGLLLSSCVTLALASLLLAVLTGSGRAGLGTVLDWLAGRADTLELDILTGLRLTRALAAFGTGACLALAGVLMQVLLRNPLADPYLLGTSGGAAVGALLVLAAGGTGWLVDGSAFAGALGSTLLVFALSGGSGAWGSNRLLLTGVVVAAGWGAAVSLILALTPDASLRGILFWLMGDFSFAERPLPTLLAAALGAVASLLLARTLDVLGTGDSQAMLLGVEVGQVRLMVYGLGAFLTASAVTTAGIVGFVGLITPHLVRLVAGSAHRIVVPCAALTGGALLVLADTLARTLLAPRQLPVGAVTAAIGVPVFLWLLRRDRGQLRPR